MSTPGIGDPYWYEWYVGIEQVIRMINPDNNISFVVFQSEIHNTIDDVVVGYKDKREICFQVKHEVGDSGKANLTFSKLIKSTTRDNGSIKMSLIRALAVGWKEAKNLDGKEIIPVLYTNRKLGVKSTSRTYDGTHYKALALDEFVKEVQKLIESNNSIEEIENIIDDKNFLTQWKEFKEAINDDTIVIDFLKAIRIRANEGSLKDLENEMISCLQNTFKCNQITAKNLFDKLCSNLRVWTTTIREKNVKVTIEDVFDVLSLNNDLEHGEHELPYPMPFFHSRQEFARSLVRFIEQEDQKVIWISGDPGSGKTSLISYLQLNHNLFKARYHTFKPISPEQKFYNADSGLCNPESLWNDLLIQLRKYFEGELNKYDIPVTNALCNTEQMRKEVIRLSKILYEKTGEKTVICIDGIDHAARANNEVTFLHTLFSPTEIPNGVVFVIAGQPAQFYDQYPLWLKNETRYVEHFHMPVLLKEDIKNLLIKKEIKLGIDPTVLSEFIYKKTKGNNLSVVFAVEEARLCEDIKEFERILDIKHVSGDITNYYSHIWKYVSDYLNKKNVGFAFPDKVVASVITLLNGRVNSEVLSKSIKIGLFKEDWDELLELLYPLVQKTNEKNEYALFHNDFRVFLMANNSESAKYKSIAFQLAEYYMQSKYSIESLNNLLPLLISSDRKDLISEIFNVEYVIHALACGMSRKKLNEYALLAYQSSVKSKEWRKYHNVYLAVNTLHQHYRYFEYYDKSYKLKDKSYVKPLNSYELRPEPLSNESLENYKKMLEFCDDLFSYSDPISKLRASSTFNLWMKDLTPLSFIKILNIDKDSLLYDQNLIDDVIRKWACLAVKLGNSYVEIDGSLHSKDEIRISLIFNDIYFGYLLETGETERALEVSHKGGVSYNCVERNLLKIFFNNQTEKYIPIFKRLSEKRAYSNDTLLAHICLINNNQDINFVDIEKLEPISHITDDTSLKAVLWSIITGYQQSDKTISVGVGLADSLINAIEKKNKDYQYLKVLMRHGFLMGRAIRGCNGENDRENLNSILKSYEEFLSYDTRGVRTFDFHEGFKILLFLSLNHKSLLDVINKDKLYELLRWHLFKNSLIGMHYKTIILDFLLDNGKDNLVKDYLLELYGNDGEKLLQEKNCEETHNCFKKYGESILPELMNMISQKLQWDVVSYVDHKEYALWPLLKYLKKILVHDSSEWKTRGLDLYRLSCIANIRGSNNASFEIQKEIGSAAINSGINDAWVLRQHDKEFCFSLDILYDQLFDMLNVASDIEEVISLWILSCGVLSWYNKEDRLGLNRIYSRCIEKGIKLGDEKIENTLKKSSPDHVNIALYQERNQFVQKKDDYTIKRDIEKKELKENFNEVSNEEIIEYLKYEQNSLMNWTSVNIAWNIIKERNMISKEVANEFTNIILNRLEDYSWENSGCSYIVEEIINVLKNDFLWQLAEYNVKNLDDNDNYYTCSSNMGFLLQYIGETLSIDFIKYMFDKELDCQYLWITGCGNLSTTFESEFQYKPINNLLTPQNIKELVCNILLEQVLTKNIHRIEISLQGLQLLVERYPDIFNFMSDSWRIYTEEQKEYVIKLSERWSQENIEGFKFIYPTIEKEYEETNELDKKIQLYSILKIYNSTLGNEREIKIKYNAKEIDYILCEYPQVMFDLDYSKISSSARTFLSIMEQVNGVSNEDIKYFLQINKDKIKDSIFKKWTRPGDSTLYPKSYTGLDMKLLYGEEKNNRWDYIPLALKAQALLNLDDAWIITKMPKVTYAKEWAIERDLSKYYKEDSLLKCIPYLEKISKTDIPKNMYNIGGTIWYPFDSENGIVYTETFKYIRNSKFNKDLSITQTLNSRSLILNLAQEDEELFIIDDEQLESNGVCLTNELVGTSVFMYGHTMMYPSSSFQELAGIKPSKHNPLIWVNSKNEVVMFFERFTYPHREAVQEHYFRQPLMGRWLCNKETIDAIANKNGLVCYKANKIDPLPNFN